MLAGIGARRDSFESSSCSKYDERLSGDAKIGSAQASKMRQRRGQDKFLHKGADVLARSPCRAGAVHIDMGVGKHRSEHDALRIGRKAMIQKHLACHEWRPISELRRKRAELTAVANQKARQKIMGAKHAMRDKK